MPPPYEYVGKDLESMSFAVNYYRWILQEFKPYLGQTIAEIGAGKGNFTHLLREYISTDSHITAIEPSSTMYPKLHEQFLGHENIQTKQGILESIFPHEKELFDSLLYVNVLEHIENDTQEIMHMHRLLKPKGYALIFVPALSWLYSPLDKEVGHYRRYHKHPLTQLFNQKGFSITRCNYFDSFGIIPWYIAFSLLKKQISNNKVSAYDNYIIPTLQKIEKWITPPIGKNLLLIAQKTDSSS